MALNDAVILKWANEIRIGRVLAMTADGRAVCDPMECIGEHGSAVEVEASPGAWAVIGRFEKTRRLFFGSYWQFVPTERNPHDPNATDRDSETG